MEPLNLLTSAAAPATVRLAIDGMTCHGCAGQVQRALSALEGVVAASVDLAQNLATVGYDPAAVSVAAIARAVEALDYGVRPVPIRD